MSQEIDLSEMEAEAKKVPVCICLDTNRDMLFIWDKEIIDATKAIVKKHEGDSALKALVKQGSRSVPLDFVIENYYNEFPEDLRRKYGGSKESMMQKKNSILNGEKQSKQVLEVFFETLKKEHKESIDVDVCVITFASGKAEVLVPFSGHEVWKDDNWLQGLIDKKLSYANDKKSMLKGMLKAVELLEERKKYYQDNEIESLRGRIVLLTKPTATSEGVFEKTQLKNKLRSRLKNYRCIPVVLGKGKGQKDGKLCGLEFPKERTEFINATTEKDSLAEIFRAISSSVSSGGVIPIDVSRWTTDPGQVVNLEEDEEEE